MRLPLLVAGLGPWIFWIAGVVLWIIRWPKGFGLFVVGAVLGWQLLKLSIHWMYRAARGFLPAGFDARPCITYLYFELEYPETAHKLKLFGDEVGCIFPDQGQLRMHTSQRDVFIPADRLTMEPFRDKNGKTQGLLLSWTQHPGAQPSSVVLGVKYLGPNMEIAGDLEKKAMWAKGVIQGWIQQNTKVLHR